VLYDSLSTQFDTICFVFCFGLFLQKKAENTIPAPYKGTFTTAMSTRASSSPVKIVYKVALDGTLHSYVPAAYVLAHS
jgi:hypothetical protein